MPEPDFRDYLLSLPNPNSQDWGDRYTPTEAELPLKVQTMTARQGDPTQQREAPKRYEVLAGLREYAAAHLLLVGKPGSGKSTALKRLRWEEAQTALSAIRNGETTYAIPVLVELRDRREGNVINWIQKALRKVRPNETEVEDLLLDGHFLLLFDGLNEIPLPEMWSALDEFQRDRDFASNPRVFTTRELGAGSDLGIEKKLEMLPLTEPQMREFIELRLPGQSDRLFSQLKNRLRELAETPLLLKMLCDVVRDSPDGQLPQNRGELFRLEFTRRYEDFKPSLTLPISGDSRRFTSELLQHLAFAMTQGDPHIDPCKPTPSWLSIAKPKAEKILEDYLTGRVDAPAQNAKEWLEDLLKFKLLVVKDQEHIEFIHQLFQEYYAAEKLLGMLDRLSDDELKQDYLNYLKWTEAIALMCGLVDENLAQDVVKLALDIDWILGARLAGNAKLQIQGKTLGLVNQLIAQENLPEWLQVELWGRTYLGLANSFLIKALSKPHCHIDIAKRAASFIGEITDQTLIKIVEDRLNDVDHKFFSKTQFGSNDPTGNLWTKHIEILAYLTPQKAINFLRRRIIDQPNGKQTIINMFTEAPQLLMQIDAEAILPELIKRFSDDQLENQQQISFLEDLLNDQSGEKRHLNPFDWEITPKFIEQFKETSVKAKKSRLLSLISYADDYESVIPNLLKALEQEEDISILIEIIRLVGRSRNKEVDKKIIGLLTHRSFKIRKEVILQLTKRKTEEIQEVEEILKHENWDFAWSAAVVLGSLGYKVVLPVLSEAIQKSGIEYVEVRRITVKVLASLNTEVSAPLLINALNADLSNEFDIFVREEAAFALSRLGKKEAIPVLRHALNSGYRDAYTNAIRGLARLNEEESLWEISGARRPGWQTATVELIKLGKSEVMPDLCQVLVDTGAESANEIIDLLSKFANLEILDWLLEALKQPELHTADPYFSNRVALVLVQCRPEILKERLSSLIQIIQERHIEHLFWVIPTIQKHCGFYNYKIAQAVGEKAAGRRQKAEDEGEERNVVYNIESVGILNTGTVINQRDQVGIKVELPPQDRQSSE